MKNEIYIDTISGEKLKKHIYCYENGKVGQEWYYLNGVKHRVDGPAYISYYMNGEMSMECYRLNGNSHKVDGPADIYYYESGKVKGEYYYLDGKVITNPSRIKEINNKKIIKESMKEESIEKNIIQTKKRKIFIIEDF